MALPFFRNYQRLGVSEQQALDGITLGFGIPLGFGIVVEDKTSYACLHCTSIKI